MAIDFVGCQPALWKAGFLTCDNSNGSNYLICRERRLGAPAFHAPPDDDTGEIYKFSPNFHRIQLGQDEVFSADIDDVIDNIEKAAVECGARVIVIDNISWICNRHSFAVNVLTKGANIKTVASLLGHTSIKMTERYLHFVDSLKQDAINSFGEIKDQTTYCKGFELQNQFHAAQNIPYLILLFIYAVI